MPELPEVEVVRRGLAQHVVGRRIDAAEFRGARVVRRHAPGAADLSARLSGNLVYAARRRGKYLWLVLGPPQASHGGSAASGGSAVASTSGLPVAPGAGLLALVVHLGMSGQLLVEESGATEEPHLRARFTFADSGPQLRFVDQRTFGGMALARLREDGIPGLVGHIAADPLEPAWDEAAVVARMKWRNSAVKRALLDQSLVSGVGNIYADEALWRARVHGERLASSLTGPALARVLRSAREVMLAALDAGGTSFDALYVDVNGASGYFDRSLDAYGQAGRPCRRCGTPIRREPFMNRSSYSCPRCQPRPRPRRGAG